MTAPRTRRLGELPAQADSSSPGALVVPLGMRGLALKGALDAAEAADDARLQAELWLDIGDALVAIERSDRAVIAWERGVVVAEGRRRETRRVLSSLFWRLGQVAEAHASHARGADGTRLLGAADAWYERAADMFAADSLDIDEAVARMALGRVRFHYQGGGLARPSVREAARLAKGAGDDLLYAEAMELATAVAFDVGDFDDAQAAARESARHYRLVPDVQGEVRATIALAEAMLEAELLLQAAQVLAPVEALLESVEDGETRGRGLALMARLQLAIGKLDDAAEPLQKAQEYLMAAGATLRAARLLVSVGRALEKREQNPKGALECMAKAWQLVRNDTDRFRVAPIAYAYAKVLHQTNDTIQADSVIEQALAWTQESADLEGLAHCTELGVRIAVKLGQGQLALDRMILLARTRGRQGDFGGEVRTLRMALEATLGVIDLDPSALADEFMEAIRRSGLAHLGPNEALQIAERLVRAERPQLAAELASLDGHIKEGAGQFALAARALAKAAMWALTAGQPDVALSHYDHALAIAEPLLLPELESWRTERQIVAEGG